jgi:hypothetical protein
MELLTKTPIMTEMRNPPKGSGGLLIAIIMGVLVDNTMTKRNNHFGPYHDNETELTHVLYEIFP